MKEGNRTRLPSVSLRSRILMGAGRLAMYAGMYVLVAVFLEKPAFPPLQTVLSRLFGSSVLEFAYHLLGTLTRWVLVFGAGAVLGVAVGVVLGYARKCQRVIAPDLDFFRSLPATVLIVFILAAFGDSNATRSFPAFYITFFTVVFFVAKHGPAVSEHRVRHLRALGASRWFIIRHCVLYELLPPTMVACRQAVSLSFLVLVSVELIVGPKDNWGLGGLLYDWKFRTDYASVIMGLFLMGIIGYALNKIALGLHTRAVFWMKVE